MAATSTDDQVPTPSHDACAFEEEDTGSPCPGRKADGFEHCLAHLEPAQLDQVLEHLRPGTDLDVSGTPINTELLARILGAMRSELEHPMFGRVSFDEARFIDGARFTDVHFTGNASFNRARFTGHASFGGAQFTGGATFEAAQFDEGTSFGGTQFTGNAFFHLAQFTGNAVFNGAHFTGDASFEGAQFNGGATFGVAQFTEHAIFGVAKFAGHATFAGAQFDRGASFDGAQFTGDASFASAQFTGDVVFKGAHFTGDASFERAQFNGGVVFEDTRFSSYARFKGSQFPEAEFLGPLTAGGLDLEAVVFDRPIVIEAEATSVSCRSTTWKAGVTLRLRFASVDLERATLTQPSFITGFDAWLPCPERLRGVDAANLSVTDVDLSRCHFAGALLLDQLRLEGRCVFDQPPGGIRAGWAWPPVWRWSRRQSLFEERLWRRATSKRAGWGTWRRQEDVVGPERLAALYRQLRKAQEDAKNEPGAADFYYGEMEMRRHARSTPWAERLILAAYWAVSGYGLRAMRAFIALALLVAGSAVVLQYAGFPGHTPAYLDSLLYAAGSVLSLSLVIGHLPTILTHWGDVIRMLLRIAGPVLLGLAALALRGRVKR